MIYKKCIMTIAKNTATLDEDIYLFRLDKNIELHFTIVNNKYKFEKSDLNNIIAQTNAAYFQIRLYRSDEIKYTFAIQPTQDGVAVLTITDDLINDPIEVGEYDFQISLLDADKTSMISMPIVTKQLHVCEPLVDNQAIMGRAVLGLSSLASGEIKNAFDSEGNYIREVHNDGDILSSQLVNKFEEALDSNTKAIKNQDIPHTISSKVLATVPAKDITLDDIITVNIVSINKDRRYYIEFLGSKKLCNVIVIPQSGNSIMCNIDNYFIQLLIDPENGTGLFVNTISPDDTTPTFTDLIIYEEEIKYLDSKYLETDLTLQNSISLGRVGNIGAGSSAIGAQVTATGNGSHAEGEGTTASGVNSHAEGDYTTASGASSHAEGYGSKASSQFQHVQGKYNIEDKVRKYAHIVGNGAGDAKRSNAHTLDWKGNGWYAGKLSQEGTPTDDKDLATKKYVDDNILLEQLPILRIDETNKRIYINCNNMGTYKKYFVPNKYANVYGFSFIYTNEDSSETEIALVGGAMTRDDFILCARNTDTLFILILGGTDKYTYTKSTKTLEKGLYGYLKIGNTQEYAPTENYNPATKKYVDDNKIAYTVSSKVLTTIPASDIKLNNEITVNNVSVNKNRKYYIEFLGSKKLCNVMVDESHGELACTIGNYGIQGMIFSSNLMLGVYKINEDDTTITFTDLILYEEEIKCLDNKYLETDLVLQNSISLGRIGDIGTKSSAIGLDVIATGMASHAEGYGTNAIGNFSHAEGNGTIVSAEDAHAEGINTIASSMYQHVQCKNNIEDKDNKYAHIVGNGVDLHNRSNAHTLDWQGNAWYSGKVTAGAAPVEDMDLTTKKYVDDKVKDTLVTTNISDTTLALTVNKYQTATVADGTEITLPTVTTFTEIHLFFSTTTDLTLTLPACKWQNGNTPTIAANKTYEFIFTYATEWLGGVIVYE